MAQLVPYEGSLEGFVPEEELETQAQPQGTQPQLVPYGGDLEGFVPEEQFQQEVSMQDQFRMQTEGWTPKQLTARKADVGQAAVDKQARFDAARQAQIDDIQNHPAIPLWVPKATG